MSLDPLSRPQSVFALQKELSRETERRYTKLSFSERLKLQLETIKTGAKTLSDRPKSCGGTGGVHEVLRLPGQPQAAAARRTKTAWAIATRGTPACSRWPTAWAATPRARWPRSWRCRPWRRSSSARPSRTADPLRFLHDAIIGRPPPAAALRHRAGAGRHPAHHHRGLPAAGQLGLLGALRRLAPVPGARRQADRPHARPLLHRAAGDAVAGGADRRQRSTATCCSPAWAARQAGGRYRRARC
jgi:hypothetical protein